MPARPGHPGGRPRFPGRPVYAYGRQDGPFAPWGGASAAPTAIAMPCGNRGLWEQVGGVADTLRGWPTPRGRPRGTRWDSNWVPGRRGEGIGVFPFLTGVCLKPTANP